MNSFDTSKLKEDRLVWDLENVKYPFAAARYSGHLTREGEDSFSFEELTSLIVFCYL